MTTNWRKDARYRRSGNPWVRKARYTAGGYLVWEERTVHTFDGPEVQRRGGWLGNRMLTDDELAEALFVDSLRYLMAG